MKANFICQFPNFLLLHAPCAQINLSLRKNETAEFIIAVAVRLNRVYHHRGFVHATTISPMSGIGCDFVFDGGMSCVDSFVKLFLDFTSLLII